MSLATKWSFKRSLLFLLLSLLAFSNAFCKEMAAAPVVNILANDNGSGLSRDFRILEDALTALGYNVNYCPHAMKSPTLKGIHKMLRTKNTTSIPQADINIFIEDLDDSLFGYAKKNYFIPNPEWYLGSLSAPKGVDLILCRTKEVERIYQGLNLPTYDLGFTSLDHYDERLDKDFSTLIHIGGIGTLNKGTLGIVDLWRTNHDLPLLHLVTSDPTVSQIKNISKSPNIIFYPDYLPDEELIYQSNACGVHLCVSSTEGFGHCLAEAMSTKAVVITTDAPPMNEFIKDKRCLVKYSHTTKQKLATKYHFDPEELKQTVKALMKLPKEELKKIGEKNRKEYLLQKQRFKEQIRQLFPKV